MNAAADPGVGSVYTLHAVVRHCNVRVGPRTLLYCTRFYFTFAPTCSTITYFGPSAERVFIIIIFYHISLALYLTEIKSGGVQSKVRKVHDQDSLSLPFLHLACP